jgi:hypothetical protein
VTLTTVLQLVRGQNLNVDPKTRNSTPVTRYYIASQNDLYQVDQFVRFFAPWGLGTTVIAIWHWFATLCCIIGAWIFQPWQWVFAEISRPLKYRSSPDASPDTRRKLKEDRKSVEHLLDGVEGDDGVEMRKVGKAATVEDMERAGIVDG